MANPTDPFGPLQNYNVNPAPTGGQGPYGMVPGTIGIPPSVWQQLGTINPALTNTTGLTNNILSEIQGDINPQALKNMQDAAAAYGVSSGMPGSNAIPGTLAFNKNLRNIGLDTLQVQQQGFKDYNSLLGSLSGLQTPQGLAAEIAAHNAQLRAAPDPTQAVNQQLANYWRALNAMRGPGGGTQQQPLGAGGGTGGIPGGGALGFGFGGLVGTRTSPTQTGGFGYGGVPGGPGLGYNWETGEYQDTTPIFPSGIGGYGGYGGDLFNPETGESPYTGYFGGDAGSQDYWNWDQTAPPSFDSGLLNNDAWMYNYENPDE